MRLSLPIVGLCTASSICSILYYDTPLYLELTERRKSTPSFLACFSCLKTERVDDRSQISSLGRICISSTTINLLLFQSSPNPEFGISDNCEIGKQPHIIDKR